MINPLEKWDFAEIYQLMKTTEQRTKIERGYLFLPGSSMGVL
jgi:hypothetical protein